MPASDMSGGGNAVNPEGRLKRLPAPKKSQHPLEQQWLAGPLSMACGLSYLEIRGAPVHLNGSSAVRLAAVGTLRDGFRLE